MLFPAVLMNIPNSKVCLKGGMVHCAIHVVKMMLYIKELWRSLPLFLELIISPRPVAPSRRAGATYFPPV